MLERLFTSRARVKILETLLLNRGEEFHTRDLARRTGVSAPYVMKELHNLKRLGILAEKKRGNMIFYGINKSSSIVEDLKRLFLKTESVGASLLDALKGKEKMIKYALIYGSFAKGNEVTSSDIDLLIIGEISEKAVVGSVMKAQSRIGREINYILWTEQAFREKAGQKTSLLREIYRTPVIMIVGDADEFKRSIKESAG
jgi:predicted nucleotidyltransferase